MGSLLPPSFCSASALLAKLVAKMHDLHAHKELNSELSYGFVITSRVNKSCFM